MFHVPLALLGRGGATLGVAGLLVTGAAIAPASAATQSVPTSAARPLSTVYYGTVVSNIPLNVRVGPTTSAAVVGTVKPGARISIQCKVVGQDVGGNSLWYKLANTTEQWVTARYVTNDGAAPTYC